MKIKIETVLQNTPPSIIKKIYINTLHKILFKRAKLFYFYELTFIDLADNNLFYRQSKF